jgi:hypothetical protein
MAVEISGALKTVSEDSRWREIIILFERLKAAKGDQAEKRFPDRFQKLIATLEAIAADAAASSEERATARRMLDKMATFIRAHTPELIRKVAEMAGDTGVSPDVRADMKRLLGDITERMPAASDKLQ